MNRQNKITAAITALDTVLNDSTIYFDEYDRNHLFRAHGVLEGLNEKQFTRVKVVKLEMTCSACPSQWEGEGENGEDIYIRFRHGYLSASVDTNEIWCKPAAGDGVMDTKTMQRHLIQMLNFSKVEIK